MLTHFPTQVNRYLFRFIKCWLKFLDCVTEDEFEITPHPQGGRLRDNVEKERGPHLSSAVTCCVGPDHSLHPSGMFAFL